MAIMTRPSTIFSASNQIYILTICMLISLVWSESTARINYLLSNDSRNRLVLHLEDPDLCIIPAISAVPPPQ
ncbi:hypothetical protein F5Y05DRAFT_390645 [Hypoxylon sp. FL0543]|nr:hypothetical protein F5Y05DRAFT_390645 [Hypoxylon sp. FL0543]